MPQDYREFVEDPTSKGTIYIAFGTFIPWDYAPPHVATAFFDAFERLPDYRFIFSYRGKFPSRKLSSHIRLVSWAPQLDVLAHPKTKIFLTHCGLKRFIYGGKKIFKNGRLFVSIKESLCSRTPMLAMPMFAEQNHNARLVLKMGIGLALNKVNKIN
jgi:glucuronosyltransferase